MNATAWLSSSRSSGGELRQFHQGHRNPGLAAVFGHLPGLDRAAAIFAGGGFAVNAKGTGGGCRFGSNFYLGLLRLGLGLLRGRRRGPGLPAIDVGQWLGGPSDGRRGLGLLPRAATEAPLAHRTARTSPAVWHVASAANRLEAPHWV